MSLVAAVAIGLVEPAKAFSGFADSAVITVAAVLILGRALEITGLASNLVRALTPGKAPLMIKLGIVLALGAFLSAWMNNIAALAITMPVMIKLCRDQGISPAVGLMPLAFTTILGGMTTLIGTPANLVLSTVREEALGSPFGFFQMTPVGAAVAGVGLVYLILVGWRLAPRRPTGAGDEEVSSLRAFELSVTTNMRIRYSQLKDRLQQAETSLLAVYRGHQRVTPDEEDWVQPGDHLVVCARENPWVAAKKVGLQFSEARSKAPDAVTAELVVGDGSQLIGLSYGAIEAETDGDLVVVAGGPRMMRERRPLRSMHLRPGDEIFIHGSAERLADFSRYGRLLEIGRKLAVPPPARHAVLVLLAYVAAILATALADAPAALTFTVAAAAICALRIVPPLEIYRSVDWPVIVLLGAMLPVGRSFGDSGAAAIAADWLTTVMGDLDLFWAVAVLTLATALFSMFLNNVATAVIMGPVAIHAAEALDKPVDAFLLAVLIGASSDFLTPIGHQNNILVMGPGGYRFRDYPRIGAALMVLVVLTTAFVLSEPRLLFPP